MLQDISNLNNYNIISKRLLAYLCDFTIISPLFMILAIISSQTSSILIFNIVSLFSFFMIFLFFTIFVFLYGQTPGKMLMNIIILDKNGNLPTLQQAILRSAAYFLTSDHLLRIIDISAIIIDSKRRSIRDFSANTIVVLSNEIISLKTRRIILQIIFFVIFLDILLLQMIDISAFENIEQSEESLK
jgi:uncharacterized RDD family membrane protein YckC